MRIRTIKPEFFTHDGLYDAEVTDGVPARVAFAGLWCAADREGRFKWEPRRLGAQILPYDKADFSRVLHALTTRGFVVKYAVDSVEYGYIPSFSRHQVINNRERESELPEPTASNICDASPTRAPRVVTRDQFGLVEGKGKEGNMEGKGKEQGTRDELCSYALEIGLAENDGVFMFEHFEETKWKRGKDPVKDWKATMRKWKAGGWLPSQKTNPAQKPAHRKNEYPQETLQLPD